MAKTKVTGTIADYPFVEVKWLDCIADNSWMTVARAEKIEPAICISKGHLLVRNKKVITIFADYSYDMEDGSLSVGNTNTIPGGWVQEVTEIIFNK